MTTELASIDFGGLAAPVEIRINQRAKRLILKVDTVHGRVIVTAPSKRHTSDALAFARSRADWIRERLSAGVRAHSFSPGAIFPYRGEPHAIVNHGPSRARIRVARNHGPRVKGEIIVGGEPAHTNRRVVDWLKRQAKARLTQRADDYAARLGVERGSITVRDTRSRWGSCASDGSLSFSWRLILAPRWVLDYVVAHECAHLIHLNHSEAYWGVLNGVNTDAAAARAWFRQYGETLHAYGVEAPPAAGER